MKRFIVTSDNINHRLGSASTVENALSIIKAKNKGHGNILELNDDGEYYKAYGIRNNKIKICRKLLTV